MPTFLESDAPQTNPLLRGAAQRPQEGPSVQRERSDQLHEVQGRRALRERRRRDFDAMMAARQRELRAHNSGSSPARSTATRTAEATRDRCTCAACLPIR